MTDALMPIYDDGFAGDHGQYIAFGTNQGTGSAPDTVIGVDVRMLGFRPLRKQLSLFCRFLCASVPLLQLPQVDGHKEKSDGCGNRKCNKGIHGIYAEAPISEVSQGKLQHNMNQCQYRKGVAERLVYDVPQMKNLLRARKK